MCVSVLPISVNKACVYNEPKMHRANFAQYLVTHAAVFRLKFILVHFLLTCLICIRFYFTVII